jgi:penicillin-binding protein 1A
VFAQLVVDLGMSKFDAMAHAMGITSTLAGNPAEVIGGVGGGVTPLEMADAYATIADGGVHHPTTILNRVVFPDHSVDNLGKPGGTRVFSDGEAYAATQVLKQVITNPGGTGTAAAFGCPAAGKTGTAENLANAWFVGYTPKLATAVWVGYPQGNIPMANGFGGSLAAPIWSQFMGSASDGYCGDFPTPSSYFSGTAFTGPHSAASGPSYPNSKSSNNGGFGTTYTNPYSNPSLYAQPTAPTGGATGTPSTGATPGGRAGTGGGTSGGGTGGHGSTGGAGSGTGGGGAKTGTGGKGAKTH